MWHKKVGCEPKQGVKGVRKRGIPSRPVLQAERIPLLPGTSCSLLRLNQHAGDQTAPREHIPLSGATCPIHYPLFTSCVWPGLLHLLCHKGLQQQQPAEVKLCVLPLKAALGDEKAPVLQHVVLCVVNAIGVALDASACVTLRHQLLGARAQESVFVCSCT